MSLDKIYLISYPFKKLDSYIILGEIYDHSTIPQLLINLKYLYPFKIINGKISNEEDFRHFRVLHKITTSVKLYNNDNNTFRTPILYNLSTKKSIKPVPSIPISIQNSLRFRIFIIFPYLNPITRGKILDTCLSMIKDKNPLFFVIGGKYGKNKTTTSTLMKRYLLLSGLPSEIIHKSLYDTFPDSLLESIELLQYVIDSYQHTDYDVFIASKSTDMLKIMKFVKNNTLFKFQYLCD